VPKLAQPMTARQHRDTTHLRQAVRQRDPSRDVLVRGIEAEVRPVLVPGDERIVTRLLDPHGEVIDEEIRADEILDGGEDYRMADKAVEPGKEEVCLGSELPGEAAQRPTLGGLEGLEHRATIARRGRGERAEGTQKAVLVVARHLRVGQSAGEFHRGIVVTPTIRVQHESGSKSPSPLRGEGRVRGPPISSSVSLLTH